MTVETMSIRTLASPFSTILATRPIAPSTSIVGHTDWLKSADGLDLILMLSSAMLREWGSLMKNSERSNRFVKKFLGSRSEKVLEVQGFTFMSWSARSPPRIIPNMLRSLGVFSKRCPLKSAMILAAASIVVVLSCGCGIKSLKMAWVVCLSSSQQQKT